MVTRSLDDLQSDGLKTFMVERQVDTTGVSGTGIVIEGVVFATGQVVIHWLTPAPMGSITIWADMAAFLSVHVTPHPENMTRIHWSDGKVWNADELPGDGFAQWESAG